ncbi:MAG: class I SAM-dependent RNA methyltransferase [Hyphomicrobiales bacterium]
MSDGIIVTGGPVGRQGESLAETSGDTLHVPYLLPGEVARVTSVGKRASLVELLEPSPARIEPFCPAFGHCGGCKIQHWRLEEYRAWKRSLVETALRHRGISAPVADLVEAHGAGRRRATLHVRRSPTGISAGFNIGRTHELHALETCPVLEPALSNAPEIATAIGEVVGESDVTFTATDTGVDVAITGAKRIAAGKLVGLADIRARYGLTRISFGAEPIVTAEVPAVAIGRAKVALPPSAFLQATRAGEGALAGVVLAAVKGARSAADLFCGVGPFALRLAQHMRILAVDSSGLAVAALAQASRRTSGLKPITVDVRDLFRQPLMPRELAAFDAVVIDPPRAGAEAQARQLARSAVRTVVSVSCDPATFARDADILLKGGYRLESVTPVDQFAWTAHVEVVGVFQK